MCENPLYNYFLKCLCVRFCSISTIYTVLEQVPRDFLLRAWLWEHGK